MSKRFYCLRDDDRDLREDEEAERGDSGAGVSSMLDVVDWNCFGNDDADTVYARRISSAMKRIRRSAPSLLTVFKLIAKNGRYRKESIFQLLTAADRRLPNLEQTQAWGRAKQHYWRSLRRLERLFGLEENLSGKGSAADVTGG